MKKFLAISIFALFISLAPATYAQQVFNIIAASGKANNIGGKPAIVGAALNTADQITVGAQGYVGLSYTKGGTVQISKQGVYKVAELEKSLLASKKSVGQKYASFIIGEITKQGDQDVHKNPYKYQNVTGSVERSLSSLVVLLPKTTDIFQGKQTFKWYGVKDNKTYSVEIYDEFSKKPVITAETTDTTYTLNADDPKLAESSMIIVQVKAKENLKANETLGKYAFSRTENAAKITEEWRKFTSENGDAANDPYLKLNEGAFLESKGLKSAAILAFEEAYRLAPQDEIVRVAFRQALIRYSIATDKQMEEIERQEAQRLQSVER